MKRTATILGIGLLVLVATASAFAAGRSALLNTEWTGLLTIVAHADNGNVTITTEDATLIFTGENGDYLAGTIKGLPSVLEFTCIKEGRSLLMTAEGYLMSGFIFPGHPVKKGARPPLHLAIQGRSVANGTMFEGALIKK